MSTIRSLIQESTGQYFNELLSKLLCFMYATLGTDFLIQVRRIEKIDGGIDLDVEILRIEPVETTDYQKLKAVLNEYDRRKKEMG